MVEQVNREIPDALAAHVHVEPFLPLVRFFHHVRASSFRYIVCVCEAGGSGGRDGGPYPPILPSLQPSKVVPCVCVCHGAVRVPRLLVQSELLCPFLIDLLCLAAPCCTRVTVEGVIGRIWTRIWYYAARVSGVVAHGCRMAGVVKLDALVV